MAATADRVTGATGIESLHPGSGFPTPGFSGPLAVPSLPGGAGQLTDSCDHRHGPGTTAVPAGIFDELTCGMKENAMKSIVIGFFLSLTLVWGGTTGKLTGTVTDAESGEPLPGCNIILEGTDLGAATDLDGSYFILNIPPGVYTVKALMIGYSTQSIEQVRIQVDLTTTLNIQLQVEAIQGEEVTVVAEKPLVQMDLTSSEARISAEDLDALPVNEIWDVINVQSGVTRDAGGGIHIRGGRQQEVAYWVDGVSVTDAYDGGLSVAVDNDAIQELQVISGTFNAEYGQAMSGIINLVTKDGGEQYRGYLSSYASRYTTGDTRLRGRDRYSFADDRNLEGSLSGPVPLLGKRLTFYTYGRWNHSKGWLYAWKIFDRWGQPLVELAAPGEPASTPEAVAMNWREKTNTNSKLTFKLNSTMKLRYNLMTSHETYQDYNHYAQYSPEGELIHFTSGMNQKLSFTHTLSSATFYTLDLSRFQKKYHHYAFPDPYSPDYIDPYYFAHQEAVLDISTFKIWGVNMSRFQRKTDTRVMKFDFTSQVNPVHQLKFGAELRNHDLTLDGYGISDADLTDTVFTIRIPGDFIVSDQVLPGQWTIMDPVDSTYIGWGWNGHNGVTPFGFNTKKQADDFIQYYNKYVQFGRGTYHEQPTEMSAYVQDKIEFKSVIINVGVRWDRFDARGVVPTNPAEPYMGNPRNARLDSLTLEERKHIDWSLYVDDYRDVLADSGASLESKRGWWSPTTVKSQLSPRLGIAYPITDKGVIHFSFGHFFQMPSFGNLYKDPGIKIPEESGKFGVFGNPDLNPQKTVMYELGLQQELAPGLSLDLTGYYRDVRDWVSTGIPVDMGGGASYYTYVNKDYSNVRGLTLNCTRQFSGFYGFSFNYTFQIAEGSNSNPDEEFGALQNNAEPTRAILPLDWDQTHTLNGNVYLGGKAWNLSFLGQFGSGYPYTPSQNVATTQGISVSTDLPKNSRRKPYTYNLDVNFQYALPLPGPEAQLFVKIFNVLDRRNEIIVYSDTGTADKTNDIQGEDNATRPNTIAEYYTHTEWYSAPRQVQIGFKINL
ncbi:MAG: TonB-dependent receptor [Candidatus Neomarinimicrobiota bacterium]|nr:MAG: TonB-dependent receptor [Candidatus Neomarinimicrobiota bacterium]